MHYERTEENWPTETQERQGFLPSWIAGAFSGSEPEPDSDEPNAPPASIWDGIATAFTGGDSPQDEEPAPDPVTLVDTPLGPVTIPDETTRLLILAGAGLALFLAVKK